jgi:hypothetical protein
MAALVGNRVRTTQPQQNPQIDWNNPIAAGLVFAYVCSSEAMGYGEDGRSVIQYVNGGGTVLGVRVNTPTGTGVQAKTSSSYAFGPVQSSVKSGVYSLFAFGTGPASGIQSAIDDDDGTNRRFQFRINAGKVELNPFYSGGNGNVVSPVALSAYDLATGFAMGATVNGTAHAIYQKGVKTTGATLPSVALTPNASIAVAARKTGTTQAWLVGGLQLVAMWNRALTDAEQASLADNPWQLFKPQPRRLWVPRAVSAAYVLQATAGAFLMFASQAALLAARRLVAAAGALTSDGVPASLVTSRRLLGSTAAFTMTGSPASITAARKIAANVGSFGFVGTVSLMTVTRRLAAQSGAFMLSPGTVQMVYTPTPGPGGPTYTLTATAGAFALTAGGADVIANRRLFAAPVEFGWSGTAARLLASRCLSAVVGGFSVDGGAAALRAARFVSAQTGAFVLDGVDAGLRYSAQVTYVRAPAGAGYAPKQNYNESRPAATSSPRPAAIQRNTR